MSEFTEFARNCLVAAGWSPGRSVPTDLFEQSNRESGFTMNPCALAFLREFGNLRLSYRSAKAPAFEDSCHFDANLAAGMADPDWVRDYETVLGSSLTVIGEAFNENMTLLMDEKGRVYCGVERTLLHLGDSAEDSINCLCEGRSVARIKVEPTLIPLPRADVTLHELARAALNQAGWTEKDGGCCSGDNVERFLNVFGGVSFSYPNREVGSDTCMIGDVTVPGALLSEFSSRIGSTVKPVGELSASGAILLMDEVGRIFAGLRETPDALWMIGASGVDAINNLVAGTIGERVF